jgi:hypothetical protein
MDLSGLVCPCSSRARGIVLQLSLAGVGKESFDGLLGQGLHGNFRRAKPIRASMVVGLENGMIAIARVMP